ncbi:MAG: family 1 glycosylhydrolase [Cyanobacteria bacterium REEB65]|nr:family 1 glycosylhydrolase [Cyanobacteria bacterium REEB65]
MSSEGRPRKRMRSRGVGFALAAASLAACSRPQVPVSTGRFLWGVSTAGHQVEGGDRLSQWHEWEATGHTRDLNPWATDSYRRWREDLDMAASMNMTAYRFSVEWSRVEPKPGKFDPAAIAHYARIAQGARARGMTPIITLFHFAYPAWLDEPDRQGRRGWERPDAADRFARYVSGVIGALGPAHPLWLTINEPTIFTYYGYIMGTWPPGKRDVSDAWRVLGHLLDAHALAYHLIHARYPDARVSFNNFALDVKVSPAVEPYSEATGSVRHRSFGQDWSFEPDLWLLRLRHPGLSKVLDYAALDYYFPMVLGQNTAMPSWQWPVYPRGLYEVIRDYAHFFGKPVLVAENGLATRGLAPRADGWTRQAYLVAHVEQVLRARAAGLPVMGYCYWSLLDNYEWGSFTPRFGLFEVNYADPDFTRTPRPVVAYYKDIAACGQVRSRLAQLINNERQAAEPISHAQVLAQEAEDAEDSTDVDLKSLPSPPGYPAPPPFPSGQAVPTPIPLSTPLSLATPPVHGSLPAVRYSAEPAVPKPIPLQLTPPPLPRQRPR